ncbi:MAG: transcriptional regulator [Desulfobacca sp.]|uniref:transcriptional regulator n=1 Tax=Desulfobacca sp. TaxID=2067990 RepID=UPI00404B200E
MSSEQNQTIRQALKTLLLGQDRSLRELSQLLSRPEKEISSHLEHLAKYPGAGYRFVILPARCRQCGFVFQKRRRVTAPSRCPRCRQTDLARPRYALVPV